MAPPELKDNEAAQEYLDDYVDNEKTSPKASSPPILSPKKRQSPKVSPKGS